MADGGSDFAHLVSILNQHAPWCLIGGLAVNCYVEEADTFNADVVIAAFQAESIKQDLTTAGFAIEELPSSISARMAGGDFEIQLTTDSRQQSFLNDTKLMAVLGERVPVASLTNVARGQILAAGDQTRDPALRKKDELHLMRLLLAYPELRSLMPEETSEPLSD